MPIKSIGKILSLGTVGLELPLAARRVFDVAGNEITQSSQLEAHQTYVLSSGEEHWAKAAAKRKRRFSKALLFQEKPAPAKRVEEPTAPEAPKLPDRDLYAVRIQRVYRGHRARRGRSQPPKKQPFTEVSLNKETTVESSKLSGPKKYATTGLQGSRQYLTASPLLSKLKAQKAPQWWEDCV